MRQVVIVLVVLALGIIGWLVWRQHQPVPFVVSGFIEADEIRAGSRIGGRIADVMVSEGMPVGKDAPLYRIEPFDLRERLAQAEAALAAYRADYARLKAGFRKEEIEQARAKRDRARAILQRLKAGPRPQEIEIAREKLKAANANLELAQTEYERISKLREAAQAAKTEYDQAVREWKAATAEAAIARQELALAEEGTRKEQIAEAEAVLADAEQALQLLENGYRPEDVAKAASQVAAAEADVAAIKVQMQELTVAAPCDCVVETIDLRPGDLVAANAPGVALLDLSRMWVRSYVPESRLGQVTLGQTVPIRVDSFPDERFPGRITYIAHDAEFTPRNIQTPEERSKQVFRIKVTIEQGLDRLRVGMAADVLFDEVVAP